MNINQVKSKAKKMGIKVGRMKKSDIIRSIQLKEGNFPCFESALSYCDQEFCSWREDCLTK